MLRNGAYGSLWVVPINAAYLCPTGTDSCWITCNSTDSDFGVSKKRFEYVHGCVRVCVGVCVCEYNNPSK